MDIYLFFVIALFVLAASDLVVGVGNDAVNFLNSAIGAKVASMKVILAVASLGVLLGTTFSSGMMEIARSGVFHPDQFYFNEIMVIFLAVMITDIILLDTFNTYGLPTSTTVSIVFELLGAAVAVAIFKIVSISGSLGELGTFINTGRALVIISGILLSVVIAFSVGTIVQFLSRLLFTFDFKRRLPYFGAIWGSVAITAIVYFILVKGASGASFMTPEKLDWIKSNTTLILGVFFVFFAFLSQVLMSVFKVNILKVIVLIGTFSIAMAFAGNDLVNFIGVPLAGFESFKIVSADPSIDPTTFTMESLLQPVQTPTLFLLAAGIIMILSLLFSKKARSVTRTEIDLARQGEGYERFPPSLLAQTIVRKIHSANKVLQKAVPDSIKKLIDRRFAKVPDRSEVASIGSAVHFDTIRASVNMFVASILIAFATSVKLPLSTTYVTFMVAMGTSLADRAWGRESAVNRVSGVITVIGGWFFTAFTAFTVAFLFAMFISWGGYIAAIVSLSLAFVHVIRTNFIHKKLVKKAEIADEVLSKKWTEESVIEESKNNIVQTLDKASILLNQVTNNFILEDRRGLKKTAQEIADLNAFTKDLKNNIFNTLKQLEKSSINTGHHYVQVIDYLREIAHCLTYIVEPFKKHLDNAHPPLIMEQQKEMLSILEEISSFYLLACQIIKIDNYQAVELLLRHNSSIIQKLEDLKRLQIKLIRENRVRTKNSLVFFNFLSETKNMLLFSINLIKSHRDFMKNNGG